MGSELERVWGENGHGKKAQEHKAAHSRVLNMWVAYEQKKLVVTKKEQGTKTKTVQSA